MAAYTYDAENRLIATAGMSYIYDGDGKRVEKCTQGTTPGTCAANATGTLYFMGSGSDPLVETALLFDIFLPLSFVRKSYSDLFGNREAGHFYERKRFDI